MASVCKQPLVVSCLMAFGLSGQIKGRPCSVIVNCLMYCT